MSLKTIKTKYGRQKSLEFSITPNVYVIADWAVTRKMMDHDEAPNISFITGHITYPNVTVEDSKYTSEKAITWYASLNTHNVYGKTRIITQRQVEHGEYANTFSSQVQT